MPVSAIASYNRIDLCTVGSLQSNTLRILPSNKPNKRQKLLIGDDSGTLHCYTLRNKTNDIECVYKQYSGRRSVTCISLYSSSAYDYTHTVNSKNVDKCYVVYGTSIHCIHRKKGNTLNVYNSSLNEDILLCYVVDIGQSTILYTTTQYSINVFELSPHKTNNEQLNALLDVEFYPSSDRIQSMCIIASKSQNKVYTCIGCSDNTVRIIYNGNVIIQYTNNRTNITYMTILHLNESTGNYNIHYILCGSDSSTLSLLCYNDKTQTIEQIWSVRLNQQNASTGTITNICVRYDRYNTDNTVDIILGSESGDIYIYEYDITQINTQPTIKLVSSINECITSIVCGYIVSTTHSDIAISTYTGKIITLTTEQIQNNNNIDVTPLINLVSQYNTNKQSTTTQQRKQQLVIVQQYEIEHFGLPSEQVATEINQANNTTNKDNNKQSQQTSNTNDVALQQQRQLSKQLTTEIERMQDDIRDLQSKLDDIKQQVKNKELESLQDSNIVSLFNQQNNIPKVRTTFKLNNNATYTLTVELPCNIDSIVIQCSIHLLVTNNNDTNNEQQQDYTITRSQQDTKLSTANGQRNSVMLINGYDNSNTNNGNINAVSDHTLLTIQYASNIYSTKCSIQLRTTEQYLHNTVLKLYILPRLQPMCCIQHELQIKSLNLHQRITDNVPDSSTFNNDTSSVLTCTGTFTLSQMHTYISMLLHDTQSRLLSENDNDKQYVYCVNTYIQSYLYIVYSSNQSTFYSNNTTTLHIIKQHLSNMSTIQNTHININIQVNTMSTIELLKSIRLQLDSIYELQRKIELIDGLSELQQHSDTDDIEWLSSDYRDILRDKDILLSQYKNAPYHITYMAQLLNDLYVNSNTLQGKNVDNGSVKELQSILSSENYTFDKLIALYKNV